MAIRSGLVLATIITASTPDTAFVPAGYTLVIKSIFASNAHGSGQRLRLDVTTDASGGTPVRLVDQLIATNSYFNLSGLFICLPNDTSSFTVSTTDTTAGMSVYVSGALLQGIAFGLEPG